MKRKVNQFPDELKCYLVSLVWERWEDGVNRERFLMRKRVL
jgi:hypothetical protein